MQFTQYSFIQYPEAAHLSSTLFSKLLGFYEKELEPIFEKINSKTYDNIINIGCAEGYYAIGMALNHPKSIVYAFDVNKEARKICYNMARLNNVDDRVIIGELCNINRLKSLELKNKSLIISDCEGYEKKIFTKDVKDLLQNHDMLIEIHDCIDSSISTQIKEVFKDTHNIQIVKSLEDFQKIILYTCNEIDSYDRKKRQELLTENRESLMEWFYIESRIN